MKGTHSLTVSSAHLKFEIELSRNITVIQGDSATGKTTLVDMIREFNLNGTDTGITLSCDLPCKVIEGADWQSQLSNIESSIVFIDEGNRFVSSKDFARAVRGSGNYYVIVTREPLSNLPYSVTEIYGIHSSGKFQSLEPVYHHLYRIYGDMLGQDSYQNGQIIIEDSNSGFDFFYNVFGEDDKRCVSAGGAGNIFSIIEGSLDGNAILIIADGAAFGSQMSKVSYAINRKHGISIYLPESCEWLILSSGIIDDAVVREIMDNPSEYIESADYFSWERFFNALLIQKTKDTWMQYSKTKLNPTYLEGRYREKIIAVLPESIRKIISE